MRTWYGRAVVAAVVLALVAAACGDDGPVTGDAAPVPEATAAAADSDAVSDPGAVADPGEDGSGGTDPDAVTEPGGEEPGTGGPEGSASGESDPSVEGGPVVEPGPVGAPHVAELAWGNFELAERIAAKLEAGERLNVVMSLAATGGGFAESFGRGWSVAGEAASGEHGVEVNARVIGPNRADAEAQAATVESLLGSGDIDCLAVEASEPGTLDAVIDAAVGAGVPVFAVGVDSPESRRFAFYGPDYTESGRAAGALVGEWAAEGGILVRVAGVLTADAGDQGSYDLMRGFVAGLGEIHSGVVWANGPDDVGSFGQDPVDVYNSTEAWVLNNSDADVVFHTDAGVEALAAVMADQLLYGDMYAVSHHMGPEVADFIRERLVAAAMSPRRFEQARLAGAACSGFLLEGVYDTGHVVVEPQAVTLDNVDSVDWSLPENL